MTERAEDFWPRLTRIAGRAGQGLVERALCLHYAALRPETPRWARAVAWSAIAYLFLPADAVPDWLPLTGYADDMLTLGYAVATIGQYVDDDVRLRARKTLARWWPRAASRPQGELADATR